ncbi:hypothetical protein K439DRAFT_1336623, partial [Ramaria rubella]
ILPALTVDGYIVTRIVQGSVDSSEFFNFNKLCKMWSLPHMTQYPGDQSVLIMDNCAIHKSSALSCSDAMVQFGHYIVLKTFPWVPHLMQKKSWKKMVQKQMIYIKEYAYQISGELAHYSPGKLNWFRYIAVTCFSTM